MYQWAVPCLLYQYVWENPSEYKGLKSFHEILVLITFAQSGPLNMHAELSSGIQSLNSSLNLHLLPSFVCASSEGSGGICSFAGSSELLLLTYA